MQIDEAREFIKFLHGAVPWNGTWFGEYAPGERGAYWWRKHLDEAVTALIAAPAAPKDHTGRWNIDVDDSDGSLWICKGEHEKSEACVNERYVPANEVKREREAIWTALDEAHWLGGDAPARIRALIAERELAQRGTGGKL